MKKLGFVILLVFSFLMIPKTVHAEEVTQDLIYIEKPIGVAVYINWETERPKVTLISPSGKKYDAMKTKNSKVKGVEYYYIDQAEAGQWKVSYDPIVNQNVTFDADEQTTNLVIKQFKIGKVNNNSIDTKFLVEDSREQVSYNYKISAVTDHSGDELVLEEGTATTNELANRTVDLSKLNSYDGYMLELYVTNRKDDLDLFDFVYSEPFSYTNSNEIQTETDYSVIINKDSNSVTISYPDLPWGVENAIVAMFVDEEEEPSQYDSYKTTANSVNYMYDASAKKLRFEFSYDYNGQHTIPKVKTADLTTSPSFVYPSDDVSNAKNVTVQYTNCDGKMASIYTNHSDKPKELVLTGDGDFSIEVEEDWTDLVIQYPVDETLIYEYEYKVFTDRKAPKLTMYEDYTKVLTNDSVYTMQGKASDFESLTIGETAVETSKNGEFSYTVKLKDGTNIIPIVAADVTGNQTVYTATITKGDDFVGPVNPSDGSVEAMSNASKTSKSGYVVQDFILLMVSVVAAIVIVILALKFWKKPTNEKK